MKTINLFLAVSLLSVATAGLAVWTCLRVIGQNQRLSEEGWRLRRDAELQAIEVRRMIADAEGMAARLEAAQLEATRLSAAAAPDVAPGQKAQANGTEPTVPLRAGRVRIVSGDRSLGGGWLVPIAAAGGATPTESVVVLDEGVRQALAAAGRTVPEREVYRETATYYQSYPYWLGYPIYGYGGSHRPPPPCPTNLPPPPPSGKVLLPESGKPFLNNQFFLPASKPFLPSTPSSAFSSPAGASGARMPQPDAMQPRRPGLGGR